MEVDYRYFHLAVHGSVILACLNISFGGDVSFCILLFLLFFKDYNHIISPSLSPCKPSHRTSLALFQVHAYFSIFDIHITYYIYMHTFITYIEIHVYS